MSFLSRPRSALAACALLVVALLPAPAPAANILFVVGSTTLIPGDQSVKTLLEGMGHAVVVRSAAAVTPSTDTVGRALVLISSSVASGDVNSKFRAGFKPVVVWENAVFDDMAMTGGISGTDFGSTASQSQVIVPASSHPLAAGLSGTVSVTSGVFPVAWGKPSAGAVRIAEQVGDGSRAVIFGYETGSTMFSFTAPGRRVGFFADDGTASAFTTNGGNLFKASVNWALNAAAPTITSQPANAAVTAGQPASFSVTASGTGPFTFQWRRNGINISGATMSSYVTPPTTGADHGAAFSVVVANAAGTATSNNATLTVNLPPTFTSQPSNQTVFESTPAAFSANATGTAPLTYQWRKNGVNIPGATSQTYNLPASTLSDNGAAFSVQVANPFGNLVSANAILTVNPAVAPTITTQPAAQSVVAPAAATFSVTASGSPGPTFQWRRNGTSIAGATGASYTTPATSGADHGALFSVVATNAAGSATSADAALSVTVPVAPSITAQPASQTVNAGASAAFSVAATGTAPLSYQWRKNGTNIAGATSASYTAPAAVFADNGAAYSVVIGNVAGSATSANATLTVLAAPSITTQPANQTVTIPATAAFSVAASGTAPLSYQWRKNGTNISGATSAAYTTPATASADNGALYSVVVTNSQGSATSSNATLTANTAPSITTQPASQSVIVGSTAAFTVAAGGTAPLSYQWRKNGANISGAISAAYTTPATVSADNGALFSVVVTNGAGSLTSSNATLTVNPVGFPTFTTQPAATAVNPGQSAGFSVSVSGSTPLTYQWRKNGTNIAGATASNYNTPPVTAADNGALYSVAVTNPQGTAFSNAVTLSVNAPPAVTTPPAPQAVLQGSSATFSVAATGTAPLAYQWLRNGASIAGATGSSYTTPPTTPSDNGVQISVAVSNVAGSVTSANALLTVNVPPTLLAQPANQAVTETMSAVFAVAASGSAPLSYQWRRNGTNIAGATGPAYTTPATSLADNGALYSVTVTNPFGNVASVNATLTVNAATAPAITTQPANQSVTLGATAAFSVAVTGSPAPTYQWRKNGTAIAGATSASYTTPATASADNGALFSVVVTNMAGSVTSANATLTVNTPPAITTQPAAQTVAAGATASFGVAASGTAPLGYQWRRNGTAIAGATSASYTTPATTSADNGALYSVAVTNVAGTATSADAALNVQFAPAFTTQPANQSVTLGATATFTAAVSANPGATWQWRKNGTAIAGATSASYTTPATASADNGAVFSVVATNALGSATSANATLTVNTPPSITTQPASQSAITGTSATFSVAAAGTAPLAYQWRKNAVNIAGATAASYTTPATVSGDNGAIFSVMVTNVAGSLLSNGATLTVLPVGHPFVTGQPADRTVDPGQAATFTVAATGNAPLTYQWRRNGANIPGATASTYSTPPATSADNNSAYSVVITNSLGSITSNNALLTVNVPPTITAQPAPATVLQGSTASFSVAATGSAPLTYQWRRNGVNISGATGATYVTPPAAAADHNAQFSVVVANSAGSATSLNASLTVNSPPSFAGQPANQTVNAGTPATFNVAVLGTAPFAYQWRRNGTNIAGATSAAYTTPATLPSDNGALFSVVVTNPFGSVTSSNATLTVIAQAPVITTQPAGVTVVLGKGATFTVAASGIPAPTYQWRRDGAAIAGATASAYTIPITVASDDGAAFTVVATNIQGSVTSAEAVLTLKPRPPGHTVSLSGELYDAAGTPIGAGAPALRDFTVRLFDEAEAGTVRYTETFHQADGLGVPVADGLFTLRLGTGNTLDDLQGAASAHAGLHAEIQVGTPGALETIQPRLPVTSPLQSGAPRMLTGTVAPTAVEPVGTYYRNTADASLHIRVQDGWVRISP